MRSNNTPPSPPPSMPPSAAEAWTRFASRHLQANYSLALYGAPNLVDVSRLNLVWLPLLSIAALSDLQAVGVCLWEPVGFEMPLHAPHSSLSNPLAVWRNTPQEPVPSHGWIEVTHDVRGGRSDPPNFPWFYVARGSGVSLNVGRTIAVDQSKGVTWCARSGPNPTSRADLLARFSCILPALASPEWLSSLDSIQLLHAWDPTDSVPWTHGFRHEILFLSTIDVAEGERLPLLTSNSTTLRCGRSPDKWVQCDAEGGALAMQRHTGMGRACRNYEKRLLKSVVHGTKPWECYPPLRDITHSCGQDLRLPTPSDPRQSWQQFLALFAILGLFALAARRPVLVVLDSCEGCGCDHHPSSASTFSFSGIAPPGDRPFVLSPRRRRTHDAVPTTHRESPFRSAIFSANARGGTREYLSLARPTAR